MNLSSLILRVKAGETFSPDEALFLFHSLPACDLRTLAHEVSVHFASRTFDFCAILSARQGRCSENCAWCAQSSFWHTPCEVHDWVGANACLQAAQVAQEKGAHHLGLVTAGRGQTASQLDDICEAIRFVRARSSMPLCGSLGLLTTEQLVLLKEAGLSRIHCNLECAPSLFPSLCTTHRTDEKYRTLNEAKKLGFQICCGGILGMGETDEQLVEFAFALKEIAPDSIPLNFLHPIPGTPLARRGATSVDTILNAIALIRLVNPQAALRFAGGRRQLTDAQAEEAIFIGINAGIAGTLLTTPGARFEDDRALAEKQGLTVLPNEYT